MTKARDFADIAGAVSNGKIASTDVNVSFENINDTGTEGTKVATGTTAQRGSTQGQWRFNSTTGFFEGYDGTTFKALDTAPTVSSVSPTDVDSSSGSTTSFTITGTGFSSGSTVKFISANGTEVTANSTTVNSTTQITAVEDDSSFANAQEPYDVKVISASGLSGQLDDQINVDTAPTWSTSSGSLGTVYDSNRSSASLSASATDAEGDTITYSVQSGSLPAGASLNSSTGAITGYNAVGSDTTSSFTLRATAGGKTADRAFSIVVKAPVSTTYSYTGSNQTFTVPTGVTLITLDIKGAGGGSQGNSGAGGTGGRTQGTRTVSAGQSYIVIVGERGKTTSSGSSFGGGGSYTSGNGNGGGGGGLSGIFLTSFTHGNSVAIAGGGGGGSYGGATGGAGGGSSGGSGSNSGGGGGTQSSGGSGAGGAGSGSALQGGSASGNGNGASGGGGYYGGGGGAEGGFDYPAGGGSGYIGGLESGATTTSGGGNSTNNDGSVVISY